jgi:hypothetical protein
MSTEYIIAFRDGSFVALDAVFPRGWRPTWVIERATRFLSMTEATLFAFLLHQEFKILPVRAGEDECTPLPAGGAFKNQVSAKKRAADGEEARQRQDNPKKGN